MPIGSAAVRDERHHPSVFWMTGRPGAGKTTLANLLCRHLIGLERSCVVLDGDLLRQGLCSDLGFSEADRRENIRRASHVATMFAQSGSSVVAALISPKADDRRLAKEIVGPCRFTEIYVDAPFEVCRARDPKGLYASALAGTISLFTGVGQSYEAPLQPDIHIRTDLSSASVSMEILLEGLAALE